MMPKITHPDLIEVGTILGYNSLTGGICQGISCMWAQALLAQDEESFFKRLELIASYKPDFKALITDLEKAKKKARLPSQQLNQKEKDLLEIPAFFDGIEMYLNPGNNPDLFDNNYVNQDDINTIYPFIQSKKLKGSQLNILFNKSHIFSKASLEAFLQDLGRQLEKAALEFPILLGNADHSVCLKYSKTKQRWLYIDTNDFSRYQGVATYFRELGTTELVDSLFTSLSYFLAKNVLFNMKVLSTANLTQLALVKAALVELDSSYPVTSELATAYDHRQLGLLFLACQKGDLNLVQTLLKHPQIKINQAKWNGTTPLGIACENGHFDVISELLKHPDISINQADNEGETPLYIACQNGYFDIVAKLLKHPDILINQAVCDLTTPLYIACQNGHFDVVAELLKQPKIEINRTESFGASPLYIACQNGHPAVVAELLKHPDLLINQRTNDGTTPLFIACQIGQPAVVELLLNTPGIDINSPGITNHTPLLVACLSPYTQNNERLFQLLLNNGASLSHKNAQGQTALDIAFACNNKAALSVLLKSIPLHQMPPLTLMSPISLNKALFWARAECPEVAEYLTYQSMGHATRFFKAPPLANRVSFSPAVVRGYTPD